MAKGQYRNAIRSKKLIKKAFTEIFKERKDVFKVTVTEIVKRADINRGTFYTHYNDVMAVLEEIEMEIINKFKLFLNDLRERHYQFNIPEFVKKLTEFLKQNEEMYKNLFSVSAPQHYLINFRELIINEVKQMDYFRNLFKSREEFVAVIRFYSAGIIATYCDYFAGETRLTIEQVANAIAKILQFMLQALIRNKNGIDF